MFILKQPPWEFIGVIELYAGRITLKTITKSIRHPPGSKLCQAVVNSLFSSQHTHTRMFNLSMQLTHSDIGKTFGLLPDQRTSNHVENPSFTGTSKNFTGPNFFYIRGAPYGDSFILDRRTATISVFISPPLFLLVKDWGLVDFPMSAQKSTLSNLWTDDHAAWFLLYQLYST